MKTNFRILSALVLSSLTFVSCQDEKPKNGGELISQTAILYDCSGSVYTEANALKANPIDIDENDPNNVIEKSFQISFVRPLVEDVDVNMSVSKEASMQYIKTTGTNYEILPESYIDIAKVIKVEKGKMSTPKIDFSVKIDDNIKLNTPYIFSIKIDKVANERCQCIKTFESSNTIIYTLIRREESTDITRVTQVGRDSYFEPESTFPNTFPNGMTMECLVNVGKFRGGPDDSGEAGISTLMGIEGKCLLRFGDAGVPPNVLQAYGEKVPFVFSTNKWYHIAAVFSPTNVMSIYVNGNKVGEYTGKVPFLNGDWYIARSWSGNRGIVAKFSEIRIWNTARTQNDIQNNFYGVPPTSSDLIAYWKMDKADGAKILDATGNGHNLIEKDQNTRQSKDISVVTEKEPVEL